VFIAKKGFALRAEKDETRRTNDERSGIRSGEENTSIDFE